MNVLIIGGPGLISTGIAKHLLARGANITFFNRAKNKAPTPSGIKTIVGDRNNFSEFESTFAGSRYDVVIDMICFNPPQAESDLRAFTGRCKQFIFCSTVCTYGVKMPPGVFVDESFPQEPISEYGRNKLACEKIFNQAHAQKKFAVTTIRPSCTYGPGGGLIDNIEFNPVAWDRIERNLPVLCAGDGLGLWVSTHRDDCGKLFAHACLNEKTYGQSYNATRDEHYTWRDHYRHVATAVGKPAKLLFLPADVIVRSDPARFGLLREITAFHGAYDSSKAKRDVPQYICEIGFEQGTSQTLADVRRRGVWRSSADDKTYELLAEKALSLGQEPVEA